MADKEENVGLERSFYPYSEYMGVISGTDTKPGTQFSARQGYIPRGHFRLRVTLSHVPHPGLIHPDDLLDLKDLPEIEQILRFAQDDMRGRREQVRGAGELDKAETGAKSVENPSLGQRLARLENIL